MSAGIPSGVTKTQDEGEIPSSVTSFPEELEAPEISPYLISFAKYNEKVCELGILNPKKAKRAVETLKKIGTKIRCLADFQREHIDRIPVRYEGDYKKLFKGLAGDIELKEIKLQEDARIFYFDIEPERTFYVIAITENHLETDKVRR
jgi:hypothetical protein